MINVISSEAPTSALGREAGAIIVENASLVLTYALSHITLRAWYYSFNTHIPSLERVFFEVPESKAKRALIELAVTYRAIHDARGLTPGLVEFEVGRLISREGKPKQLRFPEMLDKIIHASEIEWTFDDPDNPKVVCHAPQNEIEKFGWSRVEIPVKSIAEACACLPLKPNFILLDAGLPDLGRGMIVRAARPPKPPPPRPPRLPPPPPPP